VSITAGRPKTMALLLVLAALLISCDNPVDPAPSTVRQGCLENQVDFGFRIIRPNGGEVLTANAPCTLVFTAQRSMRAGFMIELGRHRFQLPGLDKAMNPTVDSLVVFTMPEYFTEQNYNPVTDDFDLLRITTAGDSCRLVMTDYSDPSVYDASDCFFTIRMP
jgi:hypothetical protein